MTKYPVKNLIEMELEEQSLEQIGTKAKRWFVDRNGNKLLFKIGRECSGENWAEKVACELCRLMGLPHAEYDLATDGNEDGVLSPSFIKRPERLFHGNELLKKYMEPNVSAYKQRHHTIGRVFAMSKLVVPPDFSLPQTEIKDGADVFVGYLLLDAWIGNQDRHDQNWGVIAAPPSKSDVESGRAAANKWLLRLAPTCDHASSLGRKLSDEERQKRLSSRDRQYDVGAYVARSRSALFATPSDAKPLETLIAFQQFALRRPKAALFWLDRLLRLDSNSVYEVFTQIPDSHISEPAKVFALRMLELNKSSLQEMMEKFYE